MAEAGDLDLEQSLVFKSGHLRASELALSPAPVAVEYGRLLLTLGAGLPAAPIPEMDLTPSERLGLAAFRLRLASDYKQAKQRRNGQGASWGGEGIFESPHPQGEPIAEAGDGPDPGPDDAAPAPSAPRMVGRIGVRVIIVSGPGALAIDAAEQTKIAAEVQNGLVWLAGQSPSKNVTFVSDIDFVQTTVADNPDGGGYEECEKPWRDDALHRLQASPGRTGIAQLTAATRTKLNVSFAYCAFFTKYSLFHFAYQRPGGAPYLVMNYANDGWGSDNIDRVFAHESCHVFGAPDEYSEAGCSCGGSWGVFGVPNINCQSCAPGSGEDCLMRANTWRMCRATPYHVGYDGLPVWGVA